MAVLIQHRQGENVTYTRLDSVKPKSVSLAFNYERDDLVFETNRKR